MKKVASTIFSFIVLLFIITQAENVSAEEISFFKEIDSVFKYVEYDEHYNSEINIEALIENEDFVSAEMMEAANLYNEWSDQNLSPDEFVSQVRSIIPSYGNWCGPGNTHSNRNYPSIDMLDAFCKNHDLCYRDKGYGNRSCDRTFARNLKGMLNNSSFTNGLSYYGKLYLRVAYEFFSRR